MKHLNDRQENILPPLSDYKVTFKDHTVPPILPKIDFWEWINANPTVIYQTNMSNRKVHMSCAKPKDVEVVLPDTDSAYTLVWAEDK